MKAINEALRQKDRIPDRPLKSIAPKDQFYMACRSCKKNISG